MIFTTHSVIYGIGNPPPPFDSNEDKKESSSVFDNLCIHLEGISLKFVMSIIFVTIIYSFCSKMEGMVFLISARIV